MGWLRGILFVCVLPALWIAGVGASLIDATQLLVIFREDRSGGDLISGCLLAGIALAGIVLWTWQIRRQVTDRGILKHCYLLLLAVLIAKIGWCCWLDSYQPNDMYRYWRYGELLANGHNLISDWIITPEIFVRRAFFYTAPIIRFVGPELRHLEMVNVVLQMATLWMLFLWGRSAIGLRAMALAMPWYVLYPDWWFAPTLASHDIPAMLLVSCVLWASEGVRCELCRPQSRLTVAWRRLLFYCVLAGVCTAYLNMVRDFGPILLLTIAMGAIFYFWGYGNLWALWANPFPLRSRDSCFMRCIVLYCLVYAGTNYVLFFISEMPEFGNSNKFPIVNLLSSVGTDADGIFPNLAPWFMQYIPGLSESERSEVVTRKLLWEKLGKGLAFEAHVYRKKQVLASAARMMEYAFCGEGGSFTRAWDNSRYAIGRNYCGILYGVMSLLMLLRLLRVDRFPIGGGESIAFIFGLGLMAPLLLATESQNTYDQLLAIPMGAAVGVLTCRGALATSNARAGIRRRRMLIGAGCLVTIVGLQVALGMVVNGLGLTFATIDQVECRAGQFDVSPARLTMDFSKPPDKVVGATELADIQFRLSGRSLEDGVLKFFLSSDHMNQKLMKAAPWGDCPWTWDLAIDGRVVLSGLVRELSSPKLKELRLTEQGRSFVQCRLVVRGEDQWAMRFVGTEDYEVVPQPRIAIEYCF